jgi:hypothetical protein
MEDVVVLQVLAAGDVTSGAGTAVDVGVDLLFADLLVDRHLIGHRLGIEPDALNRDRLLLHHWALLAQHDLVLFLADRWTGHGSVDICIGDRLPLDPDLFRDDALVFLGARSRRWSFAAPSGAAIEMRVDGFPHLALWTKPGSPFLSLEAWTGHADPDGFAGELVDKPSMIRLPPGGERRHRVELHFRAPDARAL